MNFLSKIILIAVATILMTQFSDARPNEEYMKKKEEKIQRDPLGFYDFQKNTLSNIETVISNYGMIGYDKPNSRGSGYFPRGSRNQYIFGGGLWYGAQKQVPVIDSNGQESTRLNNLVSISYDPRTADSWLTPGRFEDGESIEQDIEKYKVFLSTDFSRNTGEPLDPTDAGNYNWPVWDTNPEDTVGYSRYFGYYQYDETQRNVETFDKGPAMISGEDIFTTYNDLNLNNYEGSLSERRTRGYPLGLQYEFTIYSWGFGQYQNFFFCSYDVINVSEDTLYYCWLAPIMDVDLARDPFLRAGAANDRVSYWYENTDLNMAYQFTNPEFGEQGQGFGYLGFDFLESPTIIDPPLLDDDGNIQYEIIEKDLGGGVIILDTTYISDTQHPDYRFLRTDSAFYHNSSQLGLVTFKNWNIDDDKQNDDDKYNHISDGVTDVDFGPGDKRFMMSTGSFHMRPGDTSKTVVCIMVAPPSKSGDADGSRADREGLYSLDLFAQEVYDNNFRAPRPPDQANITYYKGLNNAVEIKWDSTSELSFDKEEAGLDFLGYRIDRARRPDLDTISTSQIAPNDEYLRGAGPYGWQEVARYELPLPFTPSQLIVDNPNTGKAPIDSMFIVGPVFDENGDISDTAAIRVMKAGSGVVFHPMTNSYDATGEYIPAIAGINPTRPWGEYYSSLADENGFTENQFANFGVRYRFDRNYQIFDTALVGTLNLDPARIPYNPLFVDQFTFEVSKAHLDTLAKDAIDGIAVVYELRDVVLNGDTVQVESSVVDSVYFVNTGRTLVQDGSESFIVDGALPIANFANAMKDSNRVKRALDSLYSFIQSGKITFEFNDFLASNTVQNNVILPYMEEITNGRTFLDIGDDDRSGNFQSNDDFDESEKLINNTPYYYRVLAYDRGDASLPTPSKINSATEGNNLIETFPEANEVGDRLKFEIIEIDSNKMNGLYDFDFYTINEDRAKQLFLGDTLQLDFDVEWSFNNFVFQSTDITQSSVILNSTPYVRRATIRNLSKDSAVIYSQFITFNPNGCFTGNNLATSMYENGAVIVQNTRAVLDDFGDTLNSFGVWNNKDYIDFSGRFTTGDFTAPNQCNSRFFQTPAYGTIGYSFNFALAQQGGRYRASEIEVVEGDAETKLYFFETGAVDLPESGTLNIQPIDTIVGAYQTVSPQPGTQVVIKPTVPIYSSFNNGPVNAIVEFTGSGTETIELEWGRDADAKTTDDTERSTFTVDYLDVKVVNNYVLQPSSDNDFTINNTNEIEHISIDPVVTGNITTVTGIEVIRKAYPDPRNLPAMDMEVEDFIGKYNIAAFAHVNIEDNNTFRTSPKSVGRAVNKPELLNIKDTYSGLPQGRYYLSGEDNNGNRVDFVNVISIAGAQFALDNRNINRRFTSRNVNLLKGDVVPEGDLTGPVEDFEVGDKVRLATAGGASGLPFPGASMKVVLKDENEGEGLTDDQMDGIKVVPNPYYISHKNEKSPYDSKLYFTKVPVGSTINIYTAAGNLVKTINHDPFATDNEGRVSVNVWDLLMNNGLRVQSQTLIAHIVAPNGAETMQKFSVVVGTFNTYD